MEVVPLWNSINIGARVGGWDKVVGFGEKMDVDLCGFVLGRTSLLKLLFVHFLNLFLV